MYILGSKGNYDGQLFKPISIAVNSSMVAVICNKHDGRVQIFETN